ncbi:hypothetical protein [Clostridium colicanis]|uniref:Uncharacterized protein n=1 Tax=Clostridium colicanis DSM 13634 TaxID=1121305 RepID=A0A151APV3_9CLOT|nr:hypothetical protein [Clostridium colicanis]KYH29600.1 hypothetical protein CLCOL_08310 [Clostridium colicanis DSM 13634]
MSRFLAPIHTWLFNKIKLYEALEKNVIDNLNNNPKTSILDILKDIENRYPAPLDDSPLEEIIDLTNIHGWLQNRIRIAETRQAYLITKVVEKFGDEGFNLVKQAYIEQGKAAGCDAAEKYSVSTPEDLFKALNNYILEGMPCDNANSIMRSEEDIIEWRTVTDLHKDYWETVGGDAANFYELRRNWVESFIESANPEFKYSFEVKYLNDVKEYLHAIVKK